MGTSAPSAMRILTIASATIKWRSNRKSLAFGRRGTYNPANRETGSGAFAFEQVTPCPRGPARKPGIPKQDPNAKRSRRNAVAAKFEKRFREKTISRSSYFPKNQGAILMKTILLTVVLGVAVVAGAQSATPPAQQGQPAAPPTSNPPTGQATQSTPTAAPVIKDPAEYNAYVSSVDPAKDANARISGLEAFITQYPNSVMKNQALEILMGTYQQANNPKKTMETATKLVTADACNERGLALLAYFDRVMAQGGDPNAKQLLVDGKKYAQQGLDCMPKFTKPDGTSDADFGKQKDQMNAIFHAALGIAEL